MPRTTTGTATPNPALQRLADARAVELTRRQDLDRWTETVSELAERLEEGDDTVTYQEQRDAEGEATRAATLHAAAVAAVEAAKRAIPNTDTSLAEAVSTAIENALGVSVSITTTKPPAPDTKALPAAFVTQSKPSIGDTIEGTIGGVLSVTYFRSRLHVAATSEAIQRAAGQTATNVRDVVTTEHDDGLLCDSIRLDVGRAFEPVPVIRRVAEDQHRLIWFAQALAGAVAQSMQSPTALTRGVRLGSSGESTEPIASVRVEAGKPTVGSDSVNGVGLRTRVVRVALTGYPGKETTQYGLEHFRANLTRACESQAGTAVPALGRVADVTVEGFTPAGVSASGHGAGGSVEARFTFVSQLPTAQPSPVAL
ncbi:MAG: hypothetical protein JWM93_375 [Frankiales bacterium]|nr:hypothetical protein [Frankiales bacterium]